MKFGIVSRRAESIFSCHGWPTVCRDDDGNLYVGASAFRLYHLCGYGKNALWISRNNGETWSCPRIFNDDALDNRDVGLCYLGEKKILATWFSLPHEFYDHEHMQTWIEKAEPAVQKAAPAILDAWKVMPAELLSVHGSFCRVSEDGGDTWSEPRKAPVSSPHGPIKLKNGKILYFGKAVKDETDALSNGAIETHISDDEGKHWKYLSTVSFDKKYFKNIHEPYAIELADDTLLGIIRAQGEEIGELLGDMCDDLKKYKFTMFKTFSKDGGVTWTKPEPLGFLGAPAHMLLHSSGAIILTYSRRSVGTQGVFARISYDNGITFGEETLIGPEAFIWDQGYPSTVELNDGSLFTVYYQRYENDTFCSLLYTKWDISEVK